MLVGLAIIGKDGGHGCRTTEMLIAFPVFGSQFPTTALLTGIVKGKKRKEVLGKLENGEIKILVGTHAIIEDSVRFSRLGLVVVDEQHRFGVAQRPIRGTHSGRRKYSGISVCEPGLYSAAASEA